jgi:hypothetical protein
MAQLPSNTNELINVASPLKSPYTSCGYHCSGGYIVSPTITQKKEAVYFPETLTTI